jgi:hypothetical protein
MNNQKSGVVTTLSDKVIMQLMTFNKCTRERAVCMYKEMLQTIADYYLMQSGVVTTLGHIRDVDASRHEIEAFAQSVCNAYGLIERHTNELTKQLC